MLRNARHCLLLVCSAVLVGTLCRYAHAQLAQLVLDKGLLNLPSSIVIPSFYQNGVRLPDCLTTNALVNDQYVATWADLDQGSQVGAVINPIIMQLAHAVYRDYPLNELGQCLRAMGITTISSISRVNDYNGLMKALVVTAPGQGTFVMFKGTNFANPGDVATDIDCQQITTLDSGTVASYFNSTENIGVHQGFFRAWQALETPVLDAITASLSAASTISSRVYFIGHSLGGAIAAIAALRFRYLTKQSPPLSAATVNGVWLFGCPRIGNEGWQTEYNRQLLKLTERFSNYADAPSRLPDQNQICPSLPTTTFQFRHIGRSVLLCPTVGSLLNPGNGLVAWQLNDSGLSEQLDCPGYPSSGLNYPDFSLKTHWLGAYLDAWRRGYTQANGGAIDTTSDPIRSTLCQQCSGCFLSDLNKQVNVIARAGGPVMCSTDASCKDRKAWYAATRIGTTYTRDYQFVSTCVNYMCTYTAVQLTATCP